MTLGCYIPHRRPVSGIVALAGVALLLAGCGGRLEAEVSGLVTLDGVPLTAGDVAFHPVVSGAPAYGTIDALGQYSLQTGGGQGLTAGEYAVVVIATAPVAPVTDPTAPERPPELLTPRKYADSKTTDLKFTVAPGRQVIDLPLTSGG